MTISSAGMEDKAGMWNGLRLLSLLSALSSDIQLLVSLFLAHNNSSNSTVLNAAVVC